MRHGLWETMCAVVGALLIALTQASCATTRGAAAPDALPAVPGETLRVVFHCAMGSGLTLSGLRIWIDGSEAQLAPAAAGSKTVVLRARIPEGPHRLQVAVGLLATSGAQVEKLHLCGHRDFYARRAQRLYMRILAFAKGNVFTRFEDRPTLSYFETGESKYATSVQKPTTPEQEAVDRALCDAALDALEVARVL